jgi:nicotinamide mononucleotide (NMN) deamidase PncC
MSAAARIKGRSAYGIGITGIGGPDGVGMMKAGTVFIGISSSKGRISNQYHFPGDRSQIIQWAALRAIVDFANFLVDFHPRKSQTKKRQKNSESIQGKVV